MREDSDFTSEDKFIVTTQNLTSLVNLPTKLVLRAKLMFLHVVLDSAQVPFEPVLQYLRYFFDRYFARNLVVAQACAWVVVKFFTHESQARRL